MNIKKKIHIDRMLVIHMKQVAETGIYDGFLYSSYVRACTQIDRRTGTKLLFTRDAGMHSCGWWKNPDYERCYHLSLSFSNPITGQPRPKNKKLTEEWINAFFSDDKRFLWIEPPCYTDGKSLDVWHYRLFCDPAWQPIKPRGEVYSKEFTERGWKSYSDQQYEKGRTLKKFKAFLKRFKRKVPVGLPGSYCIGIWTAKRGWIRYMGE